MPNHDMPLFYNTLVPLNKEQHSELTVSTSPHGFTFAAKTQSIMLATVEIFDAAKHFPIIFTATPERVLPLALLGLEPQENLFVDTEGNWQSAYVPAYIRRYPFITAANPDGQLAICFDETFDGFNQPEGIRLFEGGEPTAKTQEIQAFLHDYHGQMARTEQFCATLAQAGLLSPINAQATLNDGRSYALNGMLVVDEQKLAQLPDIDIVKLFRSGMLALIHAHLLSLRNIQSLIDRKARA